VTLHALKRSALLGLGEEIGNALQGPRLGALRRSAELPANKDILRLTEFQEPHRRGEVFVAAMMNSFVHVWRRRVEELGEVAPGKLDRGRVVEDGAKAAQHLMTMAIRALDYCPPTALTFDQYLTSSLIADRELQPDQAPYNYRDEVQAQFGSYGIERLRTNWVIGADQERALNYDRTHFESMKRDPDEIFRFIWENRSVLGTDDTEAFIKVLSVRPCVRQNSDGFILHETVAEYLQILNLTQGEVAEAIGRDVEEESEDDALRIFGGGTHRHKDHISGFAGKSGELIEALKPRVVLQPWTEKPEAQRDAKSVGATKGGSPKRLALMRDQYVHSLVDMHAFSLSALSAATPRLGKTTAGRIKFIADDNLKNRNAIERIACMGKLGTAEYLRCGDKTKLERQLPGVKVHVLGPPDLTQTETILTQRREDKDEFWQFMQFWALQAGGSGVGKGRLFPKSGHTAREARRNALVHRPGQSSIRTAASWYC
jgi:hypothetical protein